MFKTPRAVEQFLKKRALASRKNRTWVVQKYLETPLLLGGRKFDIRMLVLVTADHRSAMSVFYVRTASSAYDASNTKDSAIHLVNDAVQSQGAEYGKFEDANKLSFDELQALLDAQPLADGRVLSVMSDLWPAMKGAVSHVFSCAQHQHFGPRRRRRHELLASTSGRRRGEGQPSRGQLRARAVSSRSSA